MVTVTVDGRRTCKAITSKCVEDAVGFMIGLLIKDDPHTVSDLEVNIQFVYNSSKISNRAGGVFMLDGPATPRRFDVEIDGCKDWNNTFRSIGHELTHIKQLALGEWTIDKSGLINRWLGQIVKIDMYHYFELPWEIDAYGREGGLLLRYNEWHEGREPTPLIEIPDTTKLVLAGLASPHTSKKAQN